MRNALNIVAGVTYDPLTAELPTTRYEARILREAVGVPSYILKRAVRHWRAGETEDVGVWDEWYVLWREFGSDDEGVQLALLGLIFRRHEHRHHLDSCCTPFGWTLALALEGFYRRVRDVVDSRPGTDDEGRAIERLRANLEARRALAGNVPRLGPEHLGKALGTWELPNGRLRYRRHAAIETVAIATIETKDRVERAVSVNALLEARAIVETCGHVSGRMQAVGAGPKETVEVVALLLQLTVHSARDDYWAVLSYVFQITSTEGLAAELTSFERRMTVQLPSWFALHVEPLSPPTPDPSQLATLRFAFASKKFMTDRTVASMLSAGQVEPLLGALAEKIGGSSIPDLIRAFDQDLGAQALRIEKLPKGIQRVHLTHLNAVMRDGLGARRAAGSCWVDPLGWPEEEDPLTVLSLNLETAFEVSDAVRTAWSRSTRLSNALRVRAGPAAVRGIAESLYA